MFEDPVQYWQEITESYRQMSDGELLELAEKPEDLTDVARQVLRDEMGKRRLDASAAPDKAAAVARAGASIHWEGVGSRRLDDAAEDAADGPHEYTWKVQLCDCETTAQAWQLGEALRRAGIDSWIDPPRSSRAIRVEYPRVMVAADQLEQARLVADQPLPQDIAEGLGVDAPEASEFELPVCPRCGAGDPVLLPSQELKVGDPKPGDEDWVNRWQCEGCGAEWTDTTEDDLAGGGD